MANNKQVGGNHYRAKYQHWDAIGEIYGPEYFIGNATKYLIRWRRKNEKQDLEKSSHYLEKVISLKLPTRSNLEQNERRLKATNLLRGYPELSSFEKLIIIALLTQDDPNEWSETLHHLRDFISKG